MATTTAPATPSLGWRTPALIIGCGCLMAILTFGPRSAMGFFLQPMTQELGFGRDVFSLAIAMRTCGSAVFRSSAHSARKSACESRGASSPRSCAAITIQPGGLFQPGGLPSCG